MSGGLPSSSPSSFSLWLDACPLSIARGVLLGSLLGGGFHVIGGNFLISKGRSTLQQKHIVAEGSKAALRLGAVFGAYTAVRCSLLQATRSDAISCGLAGALAVAVPTAMDSNRVRFLQAYYAKVLGDSLLHKGGVGAGPQTMPVHFVIATSAFSGAVLFGGGDMLAHRLLGLRW